MRIVAISDTHSYHRRIEEMPEGDMIVCAGDITWRGELEIIADFANWMKELPYAYKICIHGNHELGHAINGIKRKQGLKMLEDAGITYLQDSGVEVGGFKVYGSPFTPTFYDWEYMANRGEDIAYHWSQIPDDTNILITHGPPYGILDSVEGVGIGPQGCEMLTEENQDAKTFEMSLFWTSA